MEFLLFLVSFLFGTSLGIKILFEYKEARSKGDKYPLTFIIVLGSVLDMFIYMKFTPSNLPLKIAIFDWCWFGVYVGIICQLFMKTTDPKNTARP